MKNIITSLAAIATLLLVSCATDPSVAEEDARAKSFTPAPGRANVYVCRPRTLMPWEPSFASVSIDNNDTLPTPDADNQFVMLDIPPGEHEIAISPNKLGIGMSKLKFTANRGGNVFFEIHPIFNVGVVVRITSHVSWKRVAEAEGRKNILKSKLVQGIETVN